MTNHESNKLAMYQSVISLLKANQARTVSVQALSAAVAEFEELAERIAAKDLERGDKMAGIMAQRAASQDDVIERTVAVGSALTALAHSRTDVALKERARVRFSMLRVLRPPELEEKAKAVLALAKDNKEALAPFGVTDAVLKGLQDAVAAFHRSAEAVGAGVAGRVGARQTLSELFDQTDQLLRDGLDGMVQMLRRGDRQLYDEYQAARVIRDLGSRHKPTEPIVTQAQGVGADK